jgi:hypothetical protein
MGGSLSYPLPYTSKPITVGTFKYTINIPNGTAEFLYEFEKLQLSKPPNPKLLRPISYDLWKPHHEKLVRQTTSVIWKNTNTKLLRSTMRQIGHNSDKLLNTPLPEMWKDKPHYYERDIFEVKKERTQEVEDTTIPELTKDKHKSAEILYDHFEISKDVLKSLSGEQFPGITKDPIITLQNIEIIEVNKLKFDYSLGNLDNMFNISITQEIMVAVNSEKGLSKDDRFIPLQCDNHIELTSHYNSYLTIDELRELNYVSTTFLSNIVEILGWSQELGKYLDNPEEMTELSKPDHTKLLRMINLFPAYNGDRKYRLFRHNDYPMFMNHDTRMVFRYVLDPIFKQVIEYIDRLNDTPGYMSKRVLLDRDIMYPIWPQEIKYGDKFSMDKIYRNKEQYVSPTQIMPVFFLKDKAIQKLDIQKIYLPGPDLFLTSSVIMEMSKGLKRIDLQITKRFWVVSPDLGEDRMIIPPDYDYESLPLLGNPALGYLQLQLPNIGDYTEQSKYQEAYDQVIKKALLALEHPLVGVFDKTPYMYRSILYDAHPNSIKFNPYIAFDDNFMGWYEMPVAINIIVEMVNLVGLIVNHYASQFCYCSGQEAMWFIMEMLQDWLYMDSTQAELIATGSTEHYYRTYRWIRWEAEKVFFNCDTVKGRFMGVKYAAELFGNLVQYVNQHHYNPSILWPDLSKMDYWRNQSNKPGSSPANDFKRIPDKIKPKEHSNLDTQKMDKHIYESIPK